MGAPRPKCLHQQSIKVLQTVKNRSHLTATPKFNKGKAAENLALLNMIANQFLAYLDGAARVERSISYIQVGPHKIIRDGRYVVNTNLNICIGIEDILSVIHQMSPFLNKDSPDPPTVLREKFDKIVQRLTGNSNHSLSGATQADIHIAFINGHTIRPLAFGMKCIVCSDSSLVNASKSNTIHYVARKISRNEVSIDVSQMTTREIVNTFVRSTDPHYTTYLDDTLAVNLSHVSPTFLSFFSRMLITGYATEKRFIPELAAAMAIDAGFDSQYVEMMLIKFFTYLVYGIPITKHWDLVNRLDGGYIFCDYNASSEELDVVAIDATRVHQIAEIMYRSSALELFSPADVKLHVGHTQLELSLPFKIRLRNSELRRQLFGHAALV